MMADTSWLTIDEVSSHLKVTRDTVYSYIADRGMPAHKVGRVWRFDQVEVDAWIKQGGAASRSPRKLKAARDEGEA
jgi:excisionase family DNA binding protein